MRLWSYFYYVGICVTTMNKLAELGVPLNASKVEFITSQLCPEVQVLSTLRQDLFSEAMGKALCDSGDELRARISRGDGTFCRRLDHF